MIHRGGGLRTCVRFFPEHKGLLNRAINELSFSADDEFGSCTGVVVLDDRKADGDRAEHGGDGRTRDHADGGLCMFVHFKHLRPGRRLMNLSAFRRDLLILDP